MSPELNIVTFSPQYRSYNKNATNYQSQIKLHSQPMHDCVHFEGKSLPSEYRTVFEYLSSEILGHKSKYQVNGSMLSSKNIKKAVLKLFEDSTIFSKYDKTDYRKIKWKSYIPQDIRENSVDKINLARAERLKKWESVLKAPDSLVKKSDFHIISEDAQELIQVRKELAKKLENNESLKLVIWDAVTGEIKTNNRHIPVPFDEKALLETIVRFEKILPKDRLITCTKPTFLDFYTHRLRDNLLMKMGLSNSDAVWVKIPSFAHDGKHKEENVARLEILSNKNWCTRSSVDKATDALYDGDFYIYLKRRAYGIWEPVTGMTTSRGKIDQIQGKANDNIVPINLVPEIREFIQKSGLKCHSGIISEGPKAQQALLISEKLAQKDKRSGKALYKAINENDAQVVFASLGTNTEQLENGLLKIGTYKPSYNFDAERGFKIPYSMFGINEQELLSKVEIIDGDFYLKGKKELYNSNITQIPQSLKRVTGKIVCTKTQFEKFHDDLIRLVDGDTNRIFISGY